MSKGNWRLIVDERIGLKFLDFYNKTNKMVEPTCELLNRWKQYRKPVKYVQLDNAGENKLLQQRIQSADWQDLNDIEFEFTA